VPLESTSIIRCKKYSNSGVKALKYCNGEATAKQLHSQYILIKDLIRAYVSELFYSIKLYAERII
jgi:hypothetical protein